VDAPLQARSNNSSKQQQQAATIAAEQSSHAVPEQAMQAGQAVPWKKKKMEIRTF